MCGHVRWSDAPYPRADNRAAIAMTPISAVHGRVPSIGEARPLAQSIAGRRLFRPSTFPAGCCPHQPTVTPKDCHIAPAGPSRSALCRGEGWRVQEDSRQAHGRAGFRRFLPAILCASDCDGPCHDVLPCRCHQTLSLSCCDTYLFQDF